MADETGRMSEEEKFLGVKTTIGVPGDVSVSSEEEFSDAVEVEVVDDRPEADREHLDVDPELQQYSKGVQKRIQRSTAKFHDERRAKETAERLSNEAVHYTQSLQTENQRLIKLVQDSPIGRTAQRKHRASASLSIAQENFKRAHESGDAEKITQMQQELTNAQLAQAYAPSVSQKIIDNWKRGVLAEDQKLQGEAARQPVPTEAPKPDQRAVEWQESNPWFGVDKEMTSLAYGVHERLVKDEGIDPNTDKYYELIDQRMGEIFPAQTSEDTAERVSSVVVETAPRRKASPVVAPASRNNGVAPRKVTLTATQVSLAERLGLTPQQYAVQLIKEMS